MVWCEGVGACSHLTRASGPQSPGPVAGSCLWKGSQDYPAAALRTGGLRGVRKLFPWVLVLSGLPGHTQTRLGLGC